MSGPKEQTGAGRLGQVENEAAADPLLESIAKLKQMQADLKAKELQEKQKLEDEKKRRSSQQLEAQLAEYRKEKRFLDDPSVPRPVSPVPQPTTSLPQPTPSLPGSATFLPQLATFLPRPATFLPQPATFLPRPTSPVPRLVSTMPQPATPIHFRNLSSVLEDPGFFIRPVMPEPLRLLSDRQVPREFPMLTPRVVTPPSVSRLGPNDPAERDRILSMPLFGNNESNDSDTTEASDTSDNNGNNSDSDLSDAVKFAKKKRATKKPSARKANAKKPKPKPKPSGTEHFAETTLITCKLCCQVFANKRGFNIHKTKIHNDIAAAEETQASRTATGRKRPEKKKPSPNQRKVNVNITVNNTVNHNLLGRRHF